MSVHLGDDHCIYCTYVDMMEGRLVARPGNEFNTTKLAGLPVLMLCR